MALSLAELESVTHDYFMADGGKAIDIYFNSSFLLNYLLKQKKGLYKTITGGEYIRIPLAYDGQETGFYAKGENLNSDDRVMVNAARFTVKHAYSNATIYRIDELKNNGPQEDVDLTTTRVEAAQKSITKTLADSLYDAPGGASTRLTGLRALCNATTSTAYGDIAEDDLVADDGTKPWTGRMISTSTAVSLNLLGTMRRTAKIEDGPTGKPDLIVTTEALWQNFAEIMQVQQRFTDGKETVKAGFTGLYYMGMEIFPDDFCPASHVFALNSKYVGFGVHINGNFVRLPWAMIPDSADDKTMKILWDGNLICSNRKAHIGYSAVS